MERESARCCGDGLVGRLGVWRQFRHSSTNLNLGWINDHDRDYDINREHGADHDTNHERGTDHDGGADNNRGTGDDHGGSDYNYNTSDCCSPVYRHGSTYHHSGASDDNRSNRYDSR